MCAMQVAVAINVNNRIYVVGGQHKNQCVVLSMEAGVESGGNALLLAMAANNSKRPDGAN